MKDCDFWSEQSYDGYKIAWYQEIGIQSDFLGSKFLIPVCRF